MQLIALMLATPAFIKMCWNVAEFAISARKDIATLTAAVGRLETNLNDGLSHLQTRVGNIELKMEVRDAIEHERED